MTSSNRQFVLAAQDLNESIRKIFVSAIRDGLAEGFEAAVARTKQDSSNAAVHWLVGASDGSKASSRALGKPTDLRETLRGGSRNSLIGRRGEKRSLRQKVLAHQIVEKVVSREVRIAIDPYAKGNKPSLKFYYYNALMDNPAYALNAHLEKAGNQGVKMAVKAFNKHIRAGEVRQRPL